MTQTVTIELLGGLGNQLFQWALARELQTRGTAVRLGLSQIDPLRGFALSQSPFSRVPTVPRRGGPVDALSQRFRKNPWVKEPSYTFWEGIWAAARPGTRLHGYWQSPRYFTTQAESVKRDVLDAAYETLTDAGRSLHRSLAEDHGSASVHVRRGDYASSPVARDYHGCLTADYYRKAMDALRADGVERFFVFSDDLAWCRAQLTHEGTTLVDRGVATSPLGDIGLMAACRAHAVANSSFSWWGAWLSTKHDKVIVPGTWFRGAPHDTSDLLLDVWRRAPAEFE